jgi:galactose mutarotase-like enzyme
MNQHGFARRSTFALTEHSSEYCRYELAANAETRSQYPFDFHLSVEHRLEGAKLTVSVAVVNQGERSMPFGFGFHPAFAWPLPGAEGHHHHEILLDNGAEPALSRLEGGLRRPALLPSPFRKGRLALDPALFVEDAMIFPEGAGSSLIYRAENGPELRFTFENLPNLALWTKPGAPYLCIEPWHGTAPSAGTGAAIEDRPSTFVLGTGETSRFAYSVTFPVA